MPPRLCVKPVSNVPVPSDSPLDSLIQINTDDFLAAWGFDRLRYGQNLLRWLARPSATAFARQLLAYDHQVGLGDLMRGGLALTKQYVAGLQVAGRENIPADAPVLILSNHPGLSDTVALFAAIARPDLRVIALDRPLLRSLPNTTQRLYLLPADSLGRMTVTRSVANYLRKGGAVLTFPGGEIEPDPAVLPGAVDSLRTWSESVGLFARLAPQTRIVAAIVSGVLSPQAQNNSLVKIRRDTKKREFLGATLQILWKPYRNTIVRVAFAPPLLGGDLVAVNPDPVYVTSRVTAAARTLIVNPPTQWETIF